MATDDLVDDDDESVKLSFGDLPHRVSAGAVVESTISIVDDDVPFVVVRFVPSDIVVVPEADDPATSDVTENQATVTVT